MVYEWRSLDRKRHYVSDKFRRFRLKAHGGSFAGLSSGGEKREERNRLD